MLTLYYKNKIKNIFFNIINQKPDQEALVANYHKLPKKIQVEWFRDGKFIIGTIKAEGHEYVTQALSADEFVEMVNDTLYAVYEVPSNCIYAMKRLRPKQEELKKLNNLSIKHSAMSLVREKELVFA